MENEFNLIIFKLGIKSSFVQNKEEKADKLFDTLQFWINKDSIIRIRTFAVDHDIHIHQVGLRGSIKNTIQFLIESTEKHYEDIVQGKYFLNIEDAQDKNKIKAAFKAVKLKPNLVVTPYSCYWNPDGMKYLNISKPL